MTLKKNSNGTVTECEYFMAKDTWKTKMKNKVMLRSLQETNSLCKCKLLRTLHVLGTQNRTFDFSIK